MPRPPAHAATRGTRFHAWVEAHFQTRQLGLSDLVDVDDPDVEAGLDDPLGDLGAELGDDDLGALRSAFLAGPFADRTPLAVEAPFGVSLGGIVVRGRIDAVYAEPDGGFLVVDWKTGTRAPDPIQLALYRVAIAELHDVPESQVRAMFYTVPTGEIDEPAHLPGRAELEKDLARLAADT
jgi:DNA helicase-2/ATP-dependent DNA helicase PcrA